jgi:pyruvate dehydrogenase E1 component beta subunit
MTELTFREAVRHALADELAADSRVVLLGEDIAAAGGAFKVTEGLVDRFGRDRVMDTPISEQAIVGAAIGASIKGMRPVVELMFADFAAVCFDQIANQLAKYRYMTGGQVEVPVTIRMANGASLGFGAQHSQTVESWFLNVAGLALVAPSTPQDAYRLLRAAIQSPDPVLFFEHKGLYGTKGEVDEAAPPEALGTASVRRPGTDVTIVGTQLMAARAL